MYPYEISNFNSLYAAAPASVATAVGKVLIFGASDNKKKWNKI